jgi:hypothetical protein
VLVRLVESDTAKKKQDADGNEGQLLCFFLRTKPLSKAGYSDGETHDLQQGPSVIGNASWRSAREAGPPLWDLVFG